MSDNLEKSANYLRIVRFTVDAGTEAVRDLLYYYRARENIASFFAQRTILEELKQMKQKHIITKEQYEKVLVCENVDNFDLSLLLTLLINVFNVMIDSPANGWNNPVDENDTSIGADLLRLREIRNKIIGHKPSAQISSEEYENLWKLLRNILIRIQTFVSGDGESEDHIRASIDVYETKALEPNDRIEERYLEMIEHWHNEFTSLQNEVERLCERTTEFGLLFKTDIPERYSRYVLILYEGGLLVLTSTLHEQLKQRNIDLATLLFDQRRMLIIRVKNAREVIFESIGKTNTNVSTWGLSLLADIILCLFHDDLKSLETKAIIGIKKAYENYAVSSLASTDGDKFREYWTDIIRHISTLSVLQNEKTHSECELLMKKHETGPIDEDVVKHYLGQLLQDCRPLNSLVDLYKDIRQRLKIALEAMKAKGVQFGKEHEIDLKMMTIGKSDEKRKLAEDVLYTVWQKAISMTDGSNDFQELKEAVEKIKERIKNIDDIEIKSVEKHCIVLTLKCASNTGLLDLINYTNCGSFFEEIESISKLLSDFFDENITVTAFLTLESMKQTLDTLTETYADDDEQSTYIRLSCTSVNAIENLSKLVKDNETENAFNDVAQSLSSHFDECISVESSLEMGCLGEVFANPLQGLHHSEWQTFFSPGTRKSQRTLNTSPHLSYLHSLIDDIQHPSSNILPVNWLEDVTELVHHGPVHRVSSLPEETGRRLAMLHFYDTYDDSYLHTNQSNLSNLWDSPMTPGAAILSHVNEVSGNFSDRVTENTVNWDYINSSPRNNSSRSSSVCSFA